jgi:hypothetical protein
MHKAVSHDRDLVDCSRLLQHKNCITNSQFRNAAMQLRTIGQIYPSKQIMKDEV